MIDQIGLIKCSNSSVCLYCIKNNNHNHNYKHNQLLVCLNDPEDKNAKTVILNKKDKIFKFIVPKQYNGICFSSVPHYMYFPKFGHRIMFVCTFR